jgi:hypothetical protein
VQHHQPSLPEAQSVAASKLQLHFLSSFFIFYFFYFFYSKNDSWVLRCTKLGKRCVCKHQNTRGAGSVHRRTAMARPVPDAFICPITQDVMDVPVCAPDGRSYVRAGW